MHYVNIFPKSFHLFGDYGVSYTWVLSPCNYTTLYEISVVNVISVGTAFYILCWPLNMTTQNDIKFSRQGFLNGRRTSKHSTLDWTTASIKHSWVYPYYFHTYQWFICQTLAPTLALKLLVVFSVCKISFSFLCINLKLYAFNIPYLIKY